jgi:hypothetical protein
MRLLIAEEAPLWDVTPEVTDYLGGGRTITHGPWRADDCRQILGRWFECGLIDCIAVSWATKVRSDEVVHYEYDADWRTRATEDGQHLILARDDAGALLNDPSTWREDGVGAGVMLCASDQADGLSFDAWFDKLAGLPGHLIYEHRLDEVSDGEVQETLAAPKDVPLTGLWMRAIEHAATDGLSVLCPVNRDAHLGVVWEPTEGQAATSGSIDDIVCFVDRGKAQRRRPFPFGRHRFWCPGCGAERYVVVMPSPG